MSNISQALAFDVLTDPDFVENAILLRETEGHRDNNGRWIPGSSVETAIQAVTAPISGQDRLTLPEGIRDEDIQKFWYPGAVSAVRYGLTDGDRIVKGSRGAALNQFEGDDRTAAERARNVYANANPAWLAGYRADESLVIQIYGFGRPVYQRYDAIDGHWVDAETFRAVMVNQWDGFAEIMGCRIDPGNAQ